MQPLNNDYFSEDVYLEIYCPLPTLTERLLINVLVESKIGQEFLQAQWAPTYGLGNPYRFSLAGYKLLAFSVNTMEGDPYPCNTYISVNIAKGANLGGAGSITLISGYCDKNFGLTWPEYNREEWLGLCKGVLQLTPAAAAGQPLSIALSAGLIYYPIHFSWKYVTGITPANRYAYIVYLEGGTNLMLYAATNDAVAASETAYFIADREERYNYNVPGYYSMKFVSQPLRGGQNIIINYVDIKAADQLSNLFARFKVSTI